MMIDSPLTRTLINRSAPAAVQLFTRQSLTPLSPTAFLRQPQLFWEQWERSGSDSSLVHLAETRAT
jgi:hypothetical protein